MAFSFVFVCKWDLFHILQEIEKFRQKLKSLQTDHNKLQASHEDKVTY